MAPPFKLSSCRLLSVEGRAAGDRSRQSRANQGQEGHTLWQRFSKGLVVEMPYAMELAACSEPNSCPQTEICQTEHRRFEWGVSSDRPCSLSFTHKGVPFPLHSQTTYVCSTTLFLPLWLDARDGTCLWYSRMCHRTCVLGTSR